MIPMPDRQTLKSRYDQQFEVDWDHALAAYYEQFPGHALASLWLTDHRATWAHDHPNEPDPLAGVNHKKETFDLARPGNNITYLEHWPEGMPAPDFETWKTDYTQRVQAAQAQAQADADKDDANARALRQGIQDAHDHLIEKIANTDDATQKAIMQIAVAGAQRLLG